MVASSSSGWAAAGLPSPGESSSTASYRSTLAQRVGTTLDSLSTAHASSTELLGDAALSDAVERIWDGLTRPEAGATWRQVTLDVVLESAALQRCDEDAVRGRRLFDALDLIRVHVDRKLCEPSRLFMVLEHCLELQTIDDASRVFEYVEQRIEPLGSQLTVTLARYTLLRLCNELLRRCSRHTRTVFCGRILQLLASAFPVGERSGSNITGQYNTANVTLYERASASEPAAAAEDGAMDVDEPSEVDAAAVRKAAEFYELFWSLQELIAQPTLLTGPKPGVVTADATKNMLRLRTSVPRVLEAFTAASGAEKALTGSKSSSASADRKGKARASSTASATTDVEAIRDAYFFSKYLTGKGLLDLQIADVYFRRQVLVQLLILFDHLLHYRVDAAGKGAVDGQPLLDSSDERWVIEHSIKVRIELRTTGTDGTRFAEAVDIILDREAHWVQWKMQKAEEKVFQRPALADADFARARELRAAALRPFRPYEHRVGNAQLSRLWDQSIMLDDEALLARKADRDVTGFRERIERLDGEDGNRFTPEARQGLKTSLKWRALRATGLSEPTALFRLDDALKARGAQIDDPLAQLEIELKSVQAADLTRLTEAVMSAAASALPTPAIAAAEEVDAEMVEAQEVADAVVANGLESVPGALDASTDDLTLDASLAEHVLAVAADVLPAAGDEDKDAVSADEVEADIVPPSVPAKRARSDGEADPAAADVPAKRVRSDGPDDEPTDE